MRKRDAAESYPAWLDAIAAAERYVHFESYIIRDEDKNGNLAEGYRQNVTVAIGTNPGAGAMRRGL